VVAVLGARVDIGKAALIDVWLSGLKPRVWSSKRAVSDKG